MDNNIIVRDGSTDLTEDETVDDQPTTPMIRPVYLDVIVPEAAADSSLDVLVKYLDKDGNVLGFTQSENITAAGLYSIPFFCDHPSLTDLSVVFDVTGDTPDFGAVKAYYSVARH